MELAASNPGLMIAAGLLGCGLALVSLFAVLMYRRGLSLRPIAWFACVFLLIVGPQIAVHALHDEGTTTGIPTPASARVASPAEATPQTLAALLGIDIANAMNTDVSPLFAAAAAPAQWARFVVLPDGRTATVAAYRESASAQQGVTAWLAMSGLAATAQGDALEGFEATRSAGDVVFARALGVHAVIWTAPDATALSAFVAASGVAHSVPGGARANASEVVIEPPPFGLSWTTALLALLAYTLMVAVVFIKGAAWASTLPAHRGPAVSENELRARLNAFDDTDAPFSLKQRDGGKEFVAEWRYDDARWVDHARAHLQRRAHRLVLQLDAQTGAVYVQEYATTFAASAGAAAANAQWRFVAGISFLQYETERVFGMQLDASGRPTGNWSHTWQFDAEELKSPLRELVRRAGWHWRPVLLAAPPMLHWLFR